MSFMNNKEEYDKILQIIDPKDYPEDPEFTKKINNFRYTRRIPFLFLIVICFYRFQNNKLFPVNQDILSLLVLVMAGFLLLYMNQKKKFRQEIETVVFKECRPELGISKYLSFVSKMLRSELVWSVAHYNLGYDLYMSGKIEKAHEILKLMQDSCKTASAMLMAERLKQLIALYYNDYNTAVSCAAEAKTIFANCNHTEWNNRIFNDTQKAGGFAESFLSGNYGQVFTIYQEKCLAPMDEVSRFYYLYRAAAALNDQENAENYKKYVIENAGTTWFGSALSDDFVPEELPGSYPAFSMTPENLSKPQKVDPARYKYILAGILIGLLLIYLPRLI